MKFLIPHDNRVWVRYIVVLELLVAALDLDVPIWIVKWIRISSDTSIVVCYIVISIEWCQHYSMVLALWVAVSGLKGPG